jgi:hypothetical protein
MLSKNLRNAFLVIILGIFISACSTTAKKTKTASASASSGDVYTGKDTVKYLATGVADRVFFATNSTGLTSAAKSTLDKQAGYLKAAKISVVIEGHAGVVHRFHCYMTNIRFRPCCVRATLAVKGAVDNHNCKHWLR